MKIIDIFKKSVKPDITTIPYNYDGYDIQFKENITAPTLYKKINNIITNNNFDIETIEKYKLLIETSNEESFYEFYNE